MMNKLILVVEDEETIRSQIVNWLDNINNMKILQAEHMEEARQLLQTHSEEIGLIVMDVMLPKDKRDAEEVKELIISREKAYDDWLSADKEGKNEEDPEWRNARFLVDTFDRDIFKRLDVEGGINLILEYIKKKNIEKIKIPLLFLSARENQHLRQTALELTTKECSEWLKKPIEKIDISAAVSKILYLN